MHATHVLGTGCRRRDALHTSAQQAVLEGGADCQVENITEAAKVIDVRILALSALVIDGKSRGHGRSVPSGGE